VVSGSSSSSTFRRVVVGRAAARAALRGFLLVVVRWSVAMARAPYLYGAGSG
jgi:hypothetical protein